MSTDDQFSDSEPTQSPMTDDAEAPAAHVGDSEASDGSLADLREIESKPLAERAPEYQALADRLRAELERSDPSRNPS